MQISTPILDAADVKCARQPNGHLDIVYPDGEWSDVHVTPTFPLSRRNAMVAVRDSNGEEVALLDDITKLDSDSREIMTEEMERSYFMPRITDILFAEEKMNVLTIEAETDRGPRTIQLRNPRRAIRKLPRNRVVIRDVDNNRYEIKDWTALPIYGRELLSQHM